MFEDIAKWYLIFGFITIAWGTIRYLLGKNVSQPDELLFFSWFIVWFLFLPILIVKTAKSIWKLVKHYVSLLTELI